MPIQDDEDELRWYKPEKDQLKIIYHKNRRYEPDIVIKLKGFKVMTDDITAEQKAEAV